jgi:hypothetical protein
MIETWSDSAAMEQMSFTTSFPSILEDCFTFVKINNKQLYLFIIWFDGGLTYLPVAKQ